MKLSFVIDENVLYTAHSGMDPSGNPTHDAAALITEISVNGHRVCYSTETLRKYERTLSKLEGRSILALNVPKIFFELLQDRSRSRRVDVSSVNLPPPINRKDLPFVKVAVAARPSFLVTYDCPVIEEVKQSSLTSKGLTALKVEDALTEARRADL